MSHTLSLYRLQQIDIQIDRTQVRIQIIQDKLDDDSVLTLATEQSVISKAAFESADIKLKQSEVDTQQLRIKIEQTEASLYGGKGHSPKELLELEIDVSALKRHMVLLEDIQLEAMQAIEEAMASSQTAQANLLAVQTLSTENNRDLKVEQLSLLKELERLFAERAAVVDPIPLDTRNKYDHLRQTRRGLAVAVISENSCSACGSGLSAAQMQSSRASDQMAFCPSCGRIIYGS
jgi:predicted  nucleic acid-binding Zn-ribbon protein